MKVNRTVKTSLVIATFALWLVSCTSDKKDNPLTPVVTPVSYDTVDEMGKYLVGDTVWVVWTNAAIAASGATVQFNYNRTSDNIWRTLTPIATGTLSAQVVLPSNNVTNVAQGYSRFRIFAGADTAVVESLDVKKIILTHPEPGDTAALGDTVVIQWRNHSSVASLDVILNVNGDLTYLSPEGGSTPVTSVLKWVVGHEATPYAFSGTMACYIDIDDYSASTTNMDRNTTPFYVKP